MTRGSARGARIADRLARARGSRLVARQDELGLFEAAVTAKRPPFTVLHLVLQRSQAQEQDPATALQSLLREAATALKAHPRDEKLYRAVWLTYFEPLETQEHVAERLGLPFSTYRYHLARGVERIADWLSQHLRTASHARQ